ncbi:unnamed protein product [Allacma fusca]|uniref:Transformation/transcription domain-associated protein n=1 Tax=Allacma fusca TaxID=39272 RepID=A0A8J2P1A2_9HEXA|nr:unnamed protein product [Allacma fusca]
MEHHLSVLPTLVDPTVKDDAKVKTAQDINENFETILASPYYHQFVENGVPLFLKYLQEGEPQFVAEFASQQARKSVLEILHRLPPTDVLRPYVKQILNTTFKLIEIDNEENVVICLRIIIELHKQYRPPFSPDVQQFLLFVKKVYTDLKSHMEKIFEPKIPIKIKDINDINVSSTLDEIYSATSFQSDKKAPDGSIISYNVLPKSSNSLKVLQELPIIVVLMYQIYKSNVHQEVAEFIPIVMNTITLQPSDQQRSSPNFNKEVLVEFMGAQVKTLSFLAYIIKLYQDLVVQHSDLLVQGLINLLNLCPMEVASLRRELFIAARHIMATELRFKFVPHMEELFNEDVLLGRGWTVNETMRPLAYSTLADLVHHVRQHLSLPELNRAVMFFACHVHDDSLPLSIQTMSCKLIFNLVESIRLKTEADGGNGRDILMRMLEVLVLKFRVFAEVHVPYFLDRYGTLAVTQPISAAQKKLEQKALKDTPDDDVFTKSDLDGVKEEPKRFGSSPIASLNTYSFTECRTLIKTVVCAIKTISWGIASCKGPGSETTPASQSTYKQFLPKETEIYLKLMRWGLKSVDIYSVNGPTTTTATTSTATPPTRQVSQGVRSKEEKEVLEHFAGSFTLLNTYTFREIFTVTIDFMVERIYENSALQVVANNLLANPSTSAIFATILVEYLLNKMPEMGEDVEKSNLYLRLFKLVFGSVSLFPAENEQMLRPHLRDIVNRSMELALNAKDPYNYFLLLRALFRSIGGGSHDLLYQEFLPLLPSLLQGLNNLQSGLHKQHMKDLFVELCLTVPVRLSSLLPYLPMLMDPLVSALNGSPTLVSQGLRTLELCVDNLQPEFLYEHIQPVRADLMQALWRTLRTSADPTATVAFRILGKFGGSNRKMLVEPQKLEHGDKNVIGPCAQLVFPDHKMPVLLPFEKAVECAVNLLKPSVTADIHYKKNAWQLLKLYLMAGVNFEGDRFAINKITLDRANCESEIVHIPNINNMAIYRYLDERNRQTFAAAITGMLFATNVKEIRKDVYGFIVPFLRHLSMVACAMQVGPHAGKYTTGMDPYVFFDGIAQVLASEEKEMKRPALFALAVIMNCAINIVGSKERACFLPMVELITEKMCALCYERAWYAKMGGCEAIGYFLEKMSTKWIFTHQYVIIKAMFFVLTDLTGEVSSGAVDKAKENVDQVLRICALNRDPSVAALRQKALTDCTLEFVKQLTSPITNLRDQSMKCLELLAELEEKSLHDIIKPHRDVLADTVPPKKHLIRHQSVQSQLGLLNGNTFCMNIRPKLFSADLSVQEHRIFISELVALCEADDAGLLKLPCYKNVTNLIPVRIAVIRVLACVNITGAFKDKIVSIFMKALCNSNHELQKAAFESLKKFGEENKIDMEPVQAAIRPLLGSLSQMRTISSPILYQISYLYKLYPQIVSEKVWEQLLQILRKVLEIALVNHSKNPVRSGAHDLKLAVLILSLYPMIETGSARFVEPICKLVLQAEKALLLCEGNPLRAPVMKFLKLLPQDYLKLVFCMPYITSPEWNRFFLYFLNHSEGDTIRKTLLSNTGNLLHCLKIKKNPVLPLITVSTTAQNTTANLVNHPISADDQVEIQYLAVSALSILCSHKPDWIVTGAGTLEIIEILKDIWESSDYQVVNVSAGATGVTNSLIGGKFNVQTWNEPYMVVNMLLMYYKGHVDEVDLLFKLLLAFTSRAVSQFQFLRDYLEKEVASFPIPWKRKVFFRFVEKFHDKEYPDELKAKIMQYVIIPCMTHCFEKGQGDELIGSKPMPDTDNPNNIVSVFLEQIIDPENTSSMADCVRIMVCQVGCLLVEQAAPHIHDASNKKQGLKLRRLMTWAWPCLLSKTCVDSSTKYYGHLLLSQIIAKFAIHKRIVLQVFHSLLKASAIDAKGVVKQALEILTPALPSRMEDGNTMLIHWTKKILVEEGHALAQLMHILQLIVRQWKVYYPVRHMLINHMVNAIQRLSFTATSTFEHRKLAVELAEVIIKWDLDRIRAMSDEPPEPKRLRTSKGDPKSFDRQHTDSVTNFLLRMACQVNEVNGTAGSASDLLSKRCVSLVKVVLKKEMWLNSELKLGWFDKLFASLDSTQVNYPNICTALELLTFVIGLLSKEAVLEHFKGLQKGISACMNSQNTKVIRATHSLMTKLFSIFPTEYPGVNSTGVGKHDELETLYTNVSKVIYEGLVNYEKIQTANPSALQGSIMMLKAACTNNPCYIDRLITPFTKVLLKITREHLTPGGTDAALGTELLILSLDLVKNRVGVMGVDMRKGFIGTVLVALIEKSTDPKVMQAIIKMLDEWMRNKNPIVINQGPSIREKCILLVKMMQNVEKRFSHDQELLAMYLELINFIYRDEHLKGTELNSKLEGAFLAGLRCSQAQIRSQFFQVFDASIRRRLHDRVMYILCSQNWEAMGPYYWIKQCEELLLSTAADVKLDVHPVDSKMGSISDTDSQSSHDELAVMQTGVDPELPFVQNLETNLNILQKIDETNESKVSEVVTELEDSFLNMGWNDPESTTANVKTILFKQAKFRSLAANPRLVDFITSLVQLCHHDTQLAEKVWIAFFPRAWKIFSEKQQLALANEMIPFLCSGVHIHQQNCMPSALNTFVEALCQCVPSVSMRPCVLYYLGKTHNLWHRMGLLLEQMALESGSPSQQIKSKKDTNVVDCYDFEPSANLASPATATVQQQEVLDSLSDLYTALKEDDLWAGLWQRRAKYPETNIGVAFEQQGFYEKAQAAYELAMSKAKVDFNAVSASTTLFPEFRLWEEHWIKCSKELNQWDCVLEYATTKGGASPALALDAGWRSNPNWTLMKDALTQIEFSCAKDMAWKIHLYRGYVAICSGEDQNLGIVERYVETATQLSIKEWRKLPHLISNVHVGILQAAQQIVELHEATQIHQGLIMGRANTLHDMKAVVKTWRNRLPCISDDLSHWSDIFSWRYIHYQFIANHFDGVNVGGDQAGNQTMLGVHASAQAICHFGKVVRKHNLCSVALQALTKIYNIPSVPIVDCFAKIKQQVKCYIQQAQVLGRNELQEALDIVESTNLKYFSKEMTAEFFALKGLLLSQIGRTDEANKSFSAACQLHESLHKAWGFWGDYLESSFTRDSRQLQVGVAAITAFMHACRHQNEPKARKYIAKILWLLMYDDEKGTLCDAVDKYASGVPPIQWLPWVPQLLTCLVRLDGKMVLNLLNAVGRMYPQAVYFPIRTLYLTLKIEQREKNRTAELAANAKANQLANSANNQSATPGGFAASSGNAAGDVQIKVEADANSRTAGSSGSGSSTPISQQQPQQPEAQAIKATPSMWRCSRIMHMQRDLHPTVLSSLEGIVDQIIWFRENWYEEVLRQLKMGLAKCYAVAFENRSAVLEATITPQLQNFVRKLVSTFGHASPNTQSTSGTPTIEALLRRSTVQDPSFQQMKYQFTVDFDSSLPGAQKLHNLITKLKKWIKILETKTKMFPKSFLMEDRYRFLQNFNSQVADIELPGEFLIPKHAHYYVKIARFLPRIEVVQKHNTSTRRIFIRGHNGKIYPYLIVNDSGLSDARREERVLQLIRMLNHYLSRQKVTARHNLRFTVPKVVAVSPQMRVVEDNPSSLSLLDIFKLNCIRRSVEFDSAIARYYERIAAIQTRGAQVSHQVLREILREIQANMVPRTMMKEWALNCFSPSDYWMFRKIFTLQLTLLGFAEYALHLTRLNPEMMYVHQDSGMVNIAYFKFDIDDVTGELESNRPVPFRLTPNISEFITPFGVNGPMVSRMISVARCLVYPNYKFQAILRAILRDEMIFWLKKKQDDRDVLTASATSRDSAFADSDADAVINMVTKSVNAIMNRLQSLSTFDGVESKVSTLVAAANSHDNLCRMDPAWHPWL